MRNKWHGFNQVKAHCKIFAIIFAFLMLNGCAANRATSQITPGADLGDLKKFYVVRFASDKHGINRLITNHLNDTGHPATTGPESMVPGNIDVLVTYKDKWVWDMASYMIELTITFREPTTSYPLATGNSFHSSLTRKSPEEMVDEVLTNIFAEIQKKSLLNN